MCVPAEHLYDAYNTDTYFLNWTPDGQLKTIAAPCRGYIRNHKWNDAGQLVAVVDNNHCGFYAYDGNGERVYKLTGSSIVQQVNAGQLRTLMHFYDADSFSKQSMKMYRDGIKQYSKGSVAISNANTTLEFIEDWKNMLSYDIREVNLNYHGNNQTLFIDSSQKEYLTATGNGKTNIYSNGATNVQDLPIPLGNILKATLNINSCKSKTQYPLKGNGKTLMKAFYDSFNFHIVRGTSTGVSYNRFTQQPEPQFFGQSWDYMIHYNYQNPIRRVGLPPQ